MARIKLTEEERKAKHKEYQKQYRLKNKEKINKRSKDFYYNNKEVKKESEKTRKKVYHDKNKDKLNLQKREYYKTVKNTENYKNRKRTYYEKVKDNKKEQWKKETKNWRDKNVDKIKEDKLKLKYGITIQDYNEIFEVQNGCCLGCKKHQSELKKKLFVDHCHETNKVRGLLCQNCNFILGLCKDNSDVLQSLIKYLKINNGK